MYERFSDQARRAVALANQAAQRLNHEYIGTEHLILGLLAEDCNAADILRRMTINVEHVKADVASLVQCGPAMVTMGKLPHTPRTKLVIKHAIDEAAAMHAMYLGTEHLLLGLIHEHEGVAGRVLGSRGVTLDNVKAAIAEMGHPQEGISRETVERFKFTGYELNSQHDAALEWTRQFQGKPLDLVTLADAFLAGAKWQLEIGQVKSFGFDMTLHQPVMEEAAPKQG